MAGTFAVRDDFDRLAAVSEERWDHNGHYHRLLLRQLPAHLEQVLDVGCGTGAFTRLLAQRARRVLALDLSPEMVRVARERSVQYSNIDYQVADWNAYSLSPDHFDAIATIATLHHLPLGETLARMKEALRPGGVLLVLDLFRGSGPGDLLLSLPAVPVAVLLRLLYTGRLRQPRAVRQAWAAHAPHDFYPTLAQVRHAWAAILPGAVVRRHLLWRYSIVWRKSLPGGVAAAPEEAS